MVNSPFLMQLVNLFTISVFHHTVISPVIRIVIPHHGEIVTEPLQRHEHDKGCQIRVKPHSEIRVVKHNGGSFPPLHKLQCPLSISLAESVGTKNKNGTPDSTISRGP